ncbi:regulator of chromosome condensation 1/beta-lactamase-inhibitor protein II [Flagelloscypha sp. PMI_526]|nr:regulator of chromosome condensation 1/beta-lactamase-inhibitor protein II [Flagelloscypha sp. PMI_526]
MTPRRSARVAATKPAAAKPQSVAGHKRAASDAAEAPPPKKSRKEVKNKVPGGTKKIAASMGNSKRLKQTSQAVQLVPYFNPLPTPSPKTRPPLVLFVWGAGNFGQFGMGPDHLGEFNKPKENNWLKHKVSDNVLGDHDAGLETVVAGGMHSLFVDENGIIWSCGVNDDAALGRQTESVPDPNKPNQFLDEDELTTIPHALSSLSDDHFRAVCVHSGDSICAAVSNTGALRVWGSFRTFDGQVSFSDGIKHQFHPIEPPLDLFHKPGDTEKVSSVATGSNHLLILTTHGNVYIWGSGEVGQLGRKVIERRHIRNDPEKITQGKIRTVPEKITLGNRSRRAVLVGAGGCSSFAVDEGGDVWGWGLNSLGQIGLPTKAGTFEVPRPTKIESLAQQALGGDKVVQIAGGSHHTLFLTSSGKVYATGRSDGGQLGLPDDHPALRNRDDANSDHIEEPTLVPFPDDDDPIVEISAGTHNNLAISQAGTLYTWGQGLQGELGVPKVELIGLPRAIIRREEGGWTPVHVSCGGQHTLGLFRKIA